MVTASAVPSTIVPRSTARWATRPERRNARNAARIWRPLINNRLHLLFLAAALAIGGAPLAHADCNDVANKAALDCLARYPSPPSVKTLATCKAEQDKAGSLCRGTHADDAGPCGGVTSHVENGVCWAIGITRDDCRNQLHGQTRERDGYQYCAFGAK
jgi:hypothetical protein